MSITRKCDICGNTFDTGFCIDVSMNANYDFIDIAKHRFELGKKDVCIDCYYNVKKMLTCCCIPSSNKKGESL